MQSTRALISTLFILGAAASSSAYAGGFLADTFVRPFNPELATALDKAHRSIGSPLNQVPARVGDAILGPGVGTGLAQEWEALRDARRQVQRPQPMGNRCLTPVGVSDPGPFNPVGSSCTLTTPWGVHHGRVVQ